MDVMNQKLLIKNQVVEVKQEQTLRSVLLQKMQELNLDTSDLEFSAQHILFGLDGKILAIPRSPEGKPLFQKLLDTVVKAGQTVKLFSAKKAG